MRLVIAPGIVIEPDEIAERFVKSPGPGGQNVNKVATAVELRFDVAASRLPDDMKLRVAQLAGKRISSDGVLTIDSHKYRTQVQNREDARKRLATFLRLAVKQPRARRRTKPTRASRERRIVDKKKRSERKAARRPSLD
jgi:ribosome-associated protein